MAYEMRWMRYILFFFRDTSYLYTGIITIFILGIAIGSLICAWLVSRVKAPVALFGFLQMGMTILCYPFVVAFTQFVMGVRKIAPGDVDLVRRGA